MKALYVLIVTLMIMSLTACTAGENDPVENNASSYVLINTYGARSVSETENDSDNLNLANLPAMSIAEANTILTNIRKHDQAKKTSVVNERNIIMTETVSGKISFSIQLNVEKSNGGTPMYSGYKANCTSDMFKWYQKGFSFACDKQSGNYKFESQTYLYIKVIEDGVKYMQVPLSIKGNYSPETHTADFNYSL